MLDRDLIRRHPDAVRGGIARKGLDFSVVDRFLSVDAEFRAVTTHSGELRAESNHVSRSIGQLMAQGKREEAEQAKHDAKRLKDEIAAQEEQERALSEALREIELEFPNLPHETVPNGRDETENVVIRTWGEKPTLLEPALPHWEIAEQLRLIDLPRAAKVTGSGFVFYTGLGARLQRALSAFMLDLQTGQNGYREILPPYLVNRTSLVGTGNLPKFEEDLYRTTDDLFLIPTAEVPLTNLFRDEVFDAGELPIKLAGYSACFRREAGAAGKDTRGIQRIHQFDKVEMVKFCRPEESYDELESLTQDAESVLQAVGLHYRVIELCTGDIGEKAAKIYDIEVWSPAMEKYLEISSCGNFEAYQSRRANIKMRRAPGEPLEFVHILNGSGTALPRLFACVLETFREPDGSVVVPEVLRKYMGTDRISGT